jgi:hypothetical protein
MCFHGERLDTHTGLYQMMPLKLRTNLDEQLKGWTAGRNIRVANGSWFLFPQTCCDTREGAEHARFDESAVEVSH